MHNYMTAVNDRQFPMMNDLIIGVFLTKRPEIYILFH